MPGPYRPNAEAMVSFIVTGLQSLAQRLGYESREKMVNSSEKRLLFELQAGLSVSQ
jgi:hypothetical protein